MRCKLCTLGRRQVVFGVGNPQGAPDVRGRGAGRGRRPAGRAICRPRRAAAHEDHRGDRPHARAGLHRQRHQVPAARQSQSRSRTKSSACEPFLFRQIDIDQAARDRGARQVRGAVAAAARPSRSRGCAAASSSYRGATLIPTFHPAYLLRNPSSKREVWEDMKKVRGHPAGDEQRRTRPIHAARSRWRCRSPRSACSPIACRNRSRCRLPGARVIVPLGPRTLTGVVLGEAEPLDRGSGAARRPRGPRRRRPSCPPTSSQLTRWVADYYLAGPGAALAAAMPPHAPDSARRRVSRPCASCATHATAAATCSIA